MAEYYELLEARKFKIIFLEEEVKKYKAHIDDLNAQITMQMENYEELSVRYGKA